jgi:hypothetical protein
MSAFINNHFNYEKRSKAELIRVGAPTKSARRKLINNNESEIKF